MEMYFTAIVLPEELNSRVVPLKQQMQELFGCKVGLKSPAHITIGPPFWMDPALEEELKQDVDLFCSGISPFELSTNNFSAFRPRTIFIDVAPSEALSKLKEAYNEFFRQRPQYKMKIDGRPFHPHITIATRDLHKKSFFEAWPRFEAMSFMKSWTVDELCILKHNHRDWDVWHRARAHPAHPPALPGGKGAQTEQ